MGMQNGRATLEDSFVISHKANSASWYLPKRDETVFTQNLNMYVYRNSIHNC